METLDINVCLNSPSAPHVRDYYTKEEIDEMIEALDVNSVFYASYGVTTYEELTEAWLAEKAIFCKYSDYVFPLIAYDNDDIYFSLFNNGSLLYIAFKNGVWSITETKYEPHSNKTSTISSSNKTSNVYFPTNKAVTTWVESNFSTIAAVESIEAELEEIPSTYATKAELSQVEALIDDKADSSNVYTKTEVNSIKAELTNDINTKADSDDVYDKDYVDNLEDGLTSSLNTLSSTVGNLDTTTTQRLNQFQTIINTFEDDVQDEIDTQDGKIETFKTQVNSAITEFETDINAAFNAHKTEVAEEIEGFEDYCNEVIADYDITKSEIEATYYNKDESEELFALQDGYYETLACGAAENLIGRDGDAVSATFLNRTAGGSADIADGTANIKQIKGNTIVWNQIGNQSDFPIHKYIDNSEGTSFSYSNFSLSHTLVGMSPSHKILRSITYRLNPNNSITQGSFVYQYQKNSGTYLLNGDDLSKPAGVYHKSTIFGYLYDTSKPEPSIQRYYIRIDQGNVLDLDILSANFIDLTLMFGAGNEPSTVEEFEALFPNDYYEYNAGELVSFNGTGIKTVGFNQWDEQWEKGYYNTTTGAKVTSNTHRRNVNPIKVFPNTTYYIKSATYSIFGFIYDNEGNYIGSTGNLKNKTYTTPSNCYFLNFYMYEATEYNNDICINLSWSGYRNGEYEPYWEHTRNFPISSIMYSGSPLFPNGLLSLGDVYDEITPTKAIKRVGQVDLGSLDWSLRSSTDNIWQVTGEKVIIDYLHSFPCYSIKYGYCKLLQGGASAYSVLEEGEMGQYNGASAGEGLYIKDSSITNVQELIEKLSGVILICHKRTPIEVDLVGVNLSYKVSDFGTESIIVPNNVTTSPAKLSIVYGLNAVDTLRRLPQNYISKESMENFCTALGNNLGLTITSTWDSSNNRYNYTITTNNTETNE